MPRTQKARIARSSTTSKRGRPRKHKLEGTDNVSDSSVTCTQYSPPLSTAYCVRMAIDIGTTSSTVAYQVCATKYEDPVVHIARLNKMELESPMIVRYDEFGNFHEGQDLVDQLNQGLLREDECLRFSKLALQPNKTTKVIHDKVIAHTARVGKTPQDIFLNYVDAIVMRTKTFIKGTHFGNVDDTPLELLISTPQIWAPSTNLAMVAAGKRIAAKCSIVPEPLCAAAFVLNDEINVVGHANVTLDVDDLVLVADLGGGTADMVLFRLCSAPHDGPNFALEVVRPATGNLAGATQINRNFEKWLEERHFEGNVVGFNKIASELGFEATEFSARASIAFETCKIEYPTKEVYNVVVNCRRGARRPVWVCTLQKGDIELMFRPVVGEIVKLIRDTLQGIDDPDEPSKLKSIILCGGLAGSTYLRETLVNTFRAIKFSHPLDEYKAPVAKGALLRYTMPSLQRPLGYGWSLCCIRNEIWDATLHKDATIGRKKPQPDRRVAKADPHDKKAWEVEDRCAYILDGVKNVTKQKWAIHHPPITELPIVIKTEVYFTIKPDIAEHEPLYVKGTRTVRDCFTKFCVVEKIITDPAAANIRQIRQKNGEMTWDIVSCVVIKRNADSIELGTYIRDEAEIYDERGNFIEDVTIPEHEWTDMQVIWSAQFNHLSAEIASSTPAHTSTAIEETEETDEQDDEGQILVKAEDSDDDLSDLYEFVE